MKNLLLKKIPNIDTIYYLRQNDNILSNSKLYFDDGIQFGLGFFETILVLEEGIFIDKHIERLNNSLKTFQLSMRLTISLVEKIIEQESIKNEVLKIIVTEKNIIVSRRPLSYNQSFDDKGLALSKSPVLRNSTSPLIRHKSLNYGDMILSLRDAKANGFEDYFFINEKGYLTETCIANIFIIHDNQLLTPPLKDGLLPGIIRNYVLENFPVIETHLTEKDLYKADGIFVTNSLMGIGNVTVLDNAMVPVHSLQKQIATHYFNTLKDYMTPTVKSY